MTNSHSRRYSVRVDNHIWNYALPCEWQILLSVCHPACALLSMSTSELVTNLRYSDGAHLDFSEPLIFLVRGKNNLVDDAAFSVFKGDGAVFEHPSPDLFSDGATLFRDLPDYNVVTGDEDARTHESIDVKLVVGARLPPGGFFVAEVGDAELLITFLTVVVGAEEY